MELINIQQVQKLLKSRIFATPSELKRTLLFKHDDNQHYALTEAASHTGASLRLVPTKSAGLYPAFSLLKRKLVKS